MQGTRREILKERSRTWEEIYLNQFSEKRRPKGASFHCRKDKVDKELVLDERGAWKPQNTVESIRMIADTCLSTTSHAYPCGSTIYMELKLPPKTDADHSVEWISLHRYTTFRNQIKSTPQVGERHIPVDEGEPWWVYGPEGHVGPDVAVNKLHSQEHTHKLDVQQPCDEGVQGLMHYDRHDREGHYMYDHYT